MFDVVQTVWETGKRPAWHVADGDENSCVSIIASIARSKLSMQNDRASRYSIYGFYLDGPEITTSGTIGGALTFAHSP